MTLHCSISRSDLQEGLNSLQNITSKRAALVILSNILIESNDEGLILTGTDLEVGLRITIPAEIQGQGKITLPSKKLFEIVRESGSDSLTIQETENSWVVISAGLSTYNLAGLSSNDYPEFPTFEKAKFVPFEAGVFSELIEKVSFSVANDEENAYSLTNVLFEAEKRDGHSFLKMISSDGHRLSIMERDVAVDIDLLNVQPGTLIPKKGIQELKKFCDCRDSLEVSLDDEQFVVRDRDAVMVIRLKQGEFPQYSAIVAAVQLENKIEIERRPFLDSLKRINIFTEDIFHTIQLEIDNGKMTLSSQNVDLGNATDIQDVRYQGESLLLGFNCRYFIEALQVMKCETVEAYINSSNSPCLMKSETDEGFLSIIMPMQL